MNFIHPTLDELNISNNSNIKNRINSNKINYFNKINDKPWGKEYLAYQNDHVGIWILHINKNEETSTHCHFKKDSMLLPISGCFKINLYNDYKIINIFDILYIPKFTFHGIHAYCDNSVLIEMEIYTNDISYTDKNDLLRIRDIYNRDKTNYEKSVLEREAHENEILNFHNINTHYELNRTNIFITNKLDTIENYDLVILLKGKMFNNNNIISGGSIIDKSKNISLLSNDVEILCLCNNTYKYLSKIIYSNIHLVDYLKTINNDEIFGLTSGCFDIIHSGHIINLIKSKKKVDKLFICLSSDEQVKRLKGQIRPINDINDRINMLINFEFIDKIILYSELDDNLQIELDNIINIVKPDIWFKGPDYNEKEIRILHPSLKDIMLIESGYNISTTQIINKINNNNNKIINDK